MKTLLLIAFVVMGFSPIVLRASDAPLRPGDTLELKMGGVPPDDSSLISSSYTIDGEGCLNLAYVGKVQVAGLTPSQIQSAVERSYVEKGIFTHPTVSLNISPQSRLITVGGEVNSKGRVPYTPDMTIMSAIGAAGDFTIFADQAHVRLIRGNNVEVLNCKKIRSNPSLDKKVLPGDNIQVPQGFF